MTWNLYYFWKNHFKLKFPVISVYTNFILDNYLPGPNYLGESNNPSAPQLWGLCPLDQQGGLTST